MNGWSIGYAISSVIIIAFVIVLGISFYSNQLDEDQKTEIISLAQEVAEHYQEKKINDIESFTVEEPNKRMELSKGKDGFVFKVTFLNYEDVDVQIQFPANVDNGILKIGIEYPSYNGDLNKEDAFLIVESLLILLAVTLIGASVAVWEKKRIY